MDELIIIMAEIRDQLCELNSKIDCLTNYGTNSISDITNAIEDIKGCGLFNNITDVCSKLDAIDSSLSTIDTTIMMKD